MDIPSETHNNMDEHLWCVIMAGGLGSRFWPISSVETPKQFIDVMGTGRSLLQITFDRFCRICRRDRIVIVTGEQYTDKVREQLTDLLPYQVLSEPLRRNTAPCIAYAAAVISCIDPKATLIMSPSDHAIFKQQRFVEDIMQSVATVRENKWIITLGVPPVSPDTSYGYIQFREQPSIPNMKNLHKVVTFTEKPPIEMARQFIASGEFFWNAGIFIMTMPVLKDAYKHYLPAIANTFSTLTCDSTHEELEKIYSTCDAISIDNGIMEIAENVHVLEASFGWSDVETWDTLYNVTRHDSNDNAFLGTRHVFTYDSRNCMVVTPENITTVISGLKNYIVAFGQNTLMICPRSKEEMVFKFSSDVELSKLMEKENKNTQK